MCPLLGLVALCLLRARLTPVDGAALVSKSFFLLFFLTGTFLDFFARFKKKWKSSLVLVWDNGVSHSMLTDNAAVKDLCEQSACDKIPVEK